VVITSSGLVSLLFCAEIAECAKKEGLEFWLSTEKIVECEILLYLAKNTKDMLACFGRMTPGKERVRRMVFPMDNDEGEEAFR